MAEAPSAEVAAPVEEPAAADDAPAAEESPVSEAPVAEAPVVEGAYAFQELMVFRFILCGIGMFVIGRQQRASSGFV